MSALELITAPTPRNVARDGILRARLGRSAIKRAAIVPGSGCADGPSGSDAINEANLSVAVSPGNRAKLAASCQGSTSSRASAERTLSRIPFLFSPIGANRKSSNSDPRPENLGVAFIWRDGIRWSSTIFPALARCAISGMHAAEATEQPECDENDQYQAERAANSGAAIPAIAIVAAAAAKQQDQQDDNQNCSHYPPSYLSQRGQNAKLPRVMTLLPSGHALGCSKE